MNKRQIFALATLVLVTLAFTAGAFYQYQRHAVKVDVAVQRAQAQLDSAVRQIEGLKKTQVLNLQSANAEIKDLTTAKIQLCIQVSKAKLTSSYCQ